MENEEISRADSRQETEGAGRDARDEPGRREDADVGRGKDDGEGLPETFRMENHMYHHGMFYSMPLGGLGFGLAAIQRGVPTEDVLRGLNAALFQPAVPSIEFEPIRDGGSGFNIFESAYESLVNEKYDHMGEFFTYDIGLRVLPLIPVFDLPFTGDYWVYADHVEAACGAIAAGRIKPADREDDRAYREAVIPLRGAVPSGPVTERTIRRFAGGFPGLAARWIGEMRWDRSGGGEPTCPAEAANRYAGSLFGPGGNPGVDVRSGFLATRKERTTAAGFAVSDVLFRETSEARLGVLEEYLERHLRLIPAAVAAGTGDPGLEGAAWSVDVDRSINSQEAADAQ